MYIMVIFLGKCSLVLLRGVGEVDCRPRLNLLMDDLLSKLLAFPVCNAFLTPEAAAQEPIKR